MRARSWPAIAVAATAVALVGCHRSDSVLLVEVAGDVTLQPAQLRVTVTAGNTQRVLTIPATPTTITLPTSFTVALAPTIVGPVLISVIAYDAGGAAIAGGTASQQYLNVGGETIVSVTVSASSGGSGGSGGSDAGEEGGTGAGTDAGGDALDAASSPDGEGRS